MNSKGIFLAAIVSGALGCVLFIIAIASTAWISGCMNYGDLLKNIGNMAGMDGAASSTPSGIPAGGFQGMHGENGAASDGMGFNGEGMPNLGSDSFPGANSEGGPNLDDSVLNGEGFPNFGSNSSPEAGSEGGLDLGDTGKGLPRSDSGSPLSDAIPNLDGIGGMNSFMGKLGGMKLCVSQGMFRTSVSIAGLASKAVGINVSQLPPAVIIGAVAVVISLVLAKIAVILLITAARGNIDSYQDKGKVANRTGVGMIVLVVACVFGVIGMASYTGGSEQVIHNPLLLMMQIGSSFEQEFGQMPTGRGKRDVAGLGSPFGNEGMGDILKSVSSIFNFDLHYDYAFVMGWIAAVLLVVGAILSAIAKQALISQPYMGSTNVTL